MDTSFVIVSFPRSGSNYLHGLITASFLNKTIFSSHWVKYLQKNNVIVPIRHPSESIASWVSLSNSETVESVAAWYERFYAETLKNADNIIILDFNDLINFPQKVIKYLSNKTNYLYVEPDISTINKNANIGLYKPLDINDVRLVKSIELYNALLKKKAMI